MLVEFVKDLPNVGIRILADNCLILVVVAETKVHQLDHAGAPRLVRLLSLQDRHVKNLVLRFGGFWCRRLPSWVLRENVVRSFKFLLDQREAIKFALVPEFRNHRVVLLEVVVTEVIHEEE